MLTHADGLLTQHPRFVAAESKQHAADAGAAQHDSSTTLRRASVDAPKGTHLTVLGS